MSESRAAKVWYVVGGSLLCLVFAGPLCWEVLRSFEPASALVSPPSLHTISHLATSNYRALLSGPDDILRNVLNSLVVASATAVLTAVVSGLAGYAFGLVKFPGRGVLFGVIFLALMVPFQAVLTPLFLEMHSLHMINSLLGLILFYTAYNLPFGVFVMRNSFSQVPAEVIEAPLVDGASTWSTLRWVVRPLVAPGLATSALYAFLFSWTEFLGALTFISSTSLVTLPVALDNVEVGDFGRVNFGLLSAGAVIAMVPCVVLYIALQRYYVRGLLAGAVKG